MRSADPSFRWLAALFAMACTYDPSGVGSGSGMGTSSAGDSSTGPASDPSASGTTAPTGADTSTSTTDDSTTDPGCTPGEIGCSCVDGRCDAGLSCVEGTCLSPTCGDGVLDRGEVCDDGNEIDGDGCQSDCTPTPDLDAVVGVSAGREHTCARLFDGRVVCWGRNYAGQLGYGIATGDIGDDEPAGAFGFVDTGGAVVQLALGERLTCARFDDGTVRCWGSNGQGRLGQGVNTGNIGDDESPSRLAPIALGGVAMDIAAGQRHACAVLDDGSVLCWGDGAQGRLGYGTIDDVGDDETPEQVGPVLVGAAATQVVAGEGHTCALLVGGDVRCWGHNDVGQLGLGHTDDVGDDVGEYPADVPVVDVGGTVVQLTTGRYHTCAILDDGALRCWGGNNAGQLGYGHTANVGSASAPALAGDVDVGGMVAQVALGEAHTCAVLMDGSVKCWGEGMSGRLGTADTLDRAEPPVRSIDTGLVAVERISSHRSHTCAVRADAAVLCWGEGNLGQLGYGNTDNIGDDESPASAGPVMVVPSS